MQRHSFQDGDVIFREGEHSDSAYLIVSGQVRIVRIHDADAPETLAVLGQGEYFGEMGAIDNKPRSATAMALGPVLCMSVGQDEFMDMLLNRPQDSIELLKILFERLRSANEKLARLEQAAARGPTERSS